MGRKILVIGLGSIGRRHLRNARSMLPDAEIAVFRQRGGAGEPVPEGADALFLSPEPALAFRPDAVLIASPANWHVRNALSFLENGAHLFIEKPLAVSASAPDLGIFAAAARASSRFAMVGYVLRFLPALHFIRGLLASGRLGAVRTAHVQVGQYLPDWRPGSDYREGVSARADLGGGALLELSHEIDYSLWLFGPPDSLQCSLARAGGLDIEVEDSAHLLLEYAEPARRVLVQLDFLQRAAHMALQVVGSEGTLEADLIRQSALLRTPANPDGERLAVPVTADGNEIYRRQFDFFFSRSLPGYVPVFPETAGFADWVDVAQGARVLELVDAARLADSQGRRQALQKARSHG